MILKLLFELIIGLLNIVFGWVSLPQMPEIVTNIVDTTFGYMAMGIGWIWFFVPRTLVITLLPIVLIMENFDKLYSVVMWILKKIPFLGIK